MHRHKDSIRIAFWGCKANGRRNLGSRRHSTVSVSVDYNCRVSQKSMWNLQKESVNCAEDNLLLLNISLIGLKILS